MKFSMSFLSMLALFFITSGPLLSIVGAVAFLTGLIVSFTGSVAEQLDFSAARLAGILLGAIFSIIGGQFALVSFPLFTAIGALIIAATVVRLFVTLLLSIKAVESRRYHV